MAQAGAIWHKCLMREKELRIALVCYGGISLAVYMHGVTKEVWHLARASRAFHAWPEPPPDDGHPNGGVERVYRNLLMAIEAREGLSLRVLPDIISGASAGGINGLFLAQAIHAGHSLDPLTELWLERADSDLLLDPDARLATRYLKFWAVPVVRALLSGANNAVSASVSPETQAEVRDKLSRLIRSRWFEPPFGGPDFSRLLAQALDAMAATPAGPPLLPPGHPLDLFVTATDFHGHRQPLRLHSPPIAEESEHRLTIGFHAPVPVKGGTPIADLPELVLAARATSSFPGAFPPLRVGEIDALMQERGRDWPGREQFLTRVLGHRAQGWEEVALIDGSVLVNAPFAEAMAVLPDRPAQREVDRRFVYVDPRPPVDAPRIQPRLPNGDLPPPPGFLSVIFGSLSTIPREEPVRDNLEALARQSREAERLGEIVEALRPEVESAVESVFGRTLFLNRPTAGRMVSWREKAQRAAAERAGYAWYGYARLKLSGVIDSLARLVAGVPSGLAVDAARATLVAHLGRTGVLPTGPVTQANVRLSKEAVNFLREHDLAFRIRRLRLLARRLTGEDPALAGIAPADRDQARAAVYAALAHYFGKQGNGVLGPDFPGIAEHLAEDPGAVLARIGQRRALIACDTQADGLLATAMAAMPQVLRRFVLLGYLGFAFYDAVSLPLLRSEGLTEFNPVKVDRISPQDCEAIRPGGALACLKGVEFYNFGAFFSRAYRENDYLWGRLHGAERMVDLITSTLPDGLPPLDTLAWKRAAFLAILDEEAPRLTADGELVSNLRAEVLSRLGGG